MSKFYKEIKDTIESLEVKLAESEVYKKQLNEQIWLCEELRQQLVESEKEKQEFSIKYKHWRTECEQLRQQLALTQKALQLSRDYMLKAMCADDVPSIEWFIKCAKENKDGR